MVISIVIMENPTQGPAPLMNGELAGGSKEAEHATVYASHAEEVGQQEMPQNTDLSMMPQQVYVTSGMPNHPEMVGIEEQFRSMGMVSSDHHRNLDTEGLEDEYDLEGDNDEETSDEEPLKLFVGQVRLASSVSSGVTCMRLSWLQAKFFFRVAPMLDTCRFQIFFICRFLHSCILP